jgi:hypothetical protein
MSALTPEELNNGWPRAGPRDRVDHEGMAVTRASGDVDESLLDALQDYVRRQKKRLGIANDEAAN